MLREDPIVRQFPEYLPTDEEVDSTLQLLQRPEHEVLWRLLTDEICIGGCVTSTVERLCWQAREDNKRGEDCADGAVEWLERCIATRQRLRVGSLLLRGPFTERFRAMYFKAMPFSFHRTDKQGHPVMIVRYGSVDIEAFEQLWEEGCAVQEREGLAVNAAVLFHIRAMEYVTKVVMAAETKRQGRVVDRILVIGDIGGLGLEHLSSPLKTFLSSVSAESLSLFPGTMHATVVANVPWLVASLAWPIVRAFIHPVTQCKIMMFSTPEEVTAKLLELMDPEDIPPYFGGRCSCEECVSGALQGGSLKAWEEGETSELAGTDPRMQAPGLQRSAQDLGAVNDRREDPLVSSGPPTLTLERAERVSKRQHWWLIAPLVSLAFAVLATQRRDWLQWRRWLR